VRNHKSCGPIQSAASAGQLEATLQLVRVGASWRPVRGLAGAAAAAAPADTDIVRMLARKAGYKVHGAGVAANSAFACME
jgi:hypothetical protein